MAKSEQEQKGEKVELTWVVGKAGRLICGRIPPSMDFLEGIEEICRSAGITSGNLISCVGSLQKFSFIHPKPKEGAFLGAVYDEEQVDGPLEILSAQGSIGVDEEGNLFYHIHGVVVAGDGRVWGGHFIKEGMEMPDGRIVCGGNPILATMEVTIVEPDGVQIRRKTDPYLGVKLLIPEKAEQASENLTQAKGITREKQKIVWQSPKGRIIVVDTISYTDKSNKGDVIVGGSHCGENSGEYLSSLKVQGVILNDTGKGKDNAGIRGLAVLEKHGIPGACVSAMSARIGDGMSTYEEGEISAVNKPARNLGISIGMSAEEAAKRML